MRALEHFLLEGLRGHIHLFDTSFSSSRRPCHGRETAAIQLLQLYNCLAYSQRSDDAPAPTPRRARRADRTPLPRARRAVADPPPLPASGRRGDRQRADRRAQYLAAERLQAPAAAGRGWHRRPPQTGQPRLLPDRRRGGPPPLRAGLRERPGPALRTQHAARGERALNLFLRQRPLID